MKILPSWLREFVDLKVDLTSEADVRRFADDLTHAGVSVESIQFADENTVFQMEITTNRVDAMNHYGIARECAAIYDLELKSLHADLPPGKGDAAFAIEIHAPEHCARYTAQVIRNVKIGPAPAAMQERFRLLEQKPINNAADATNYNLLEMGHPTHAFDLDKLAGGKIIVRLAREGEKLRTLDGEERTLSAQDLVIADADRAVALAGIMGGWDTMITESTRNVLIESAWFEPATVRATARRLGMHTDASHRFERGADWGATTLACARVAQHILGSGGGELIGGQIDAIAREVRRPAIQLRRGEVKRHLGIEMADTEVQRILSRLGFGVTAGQVAGVSTPDAAMTTGRGGARAAIAETVADFAVQLPTWRLDVEREIDLIEEIARIYGYNRFPNTLPSFAGGVVELPHARKEESIRRTLLALGYHEAISSTFISAEEARSASDDAAIELENPLNEELAVMRTSLLPGMTAMLARNVNRGSDDVRLFEMGHVFRMKGNASDEHKLCAIGATGGAVAASVHEPMRGFNFFDLKGAVESLLHLFAYESLSFEAAAGPNYHPGRSARALMDGKVVARLGQLHPNVAAARKVRNRELYAAELYLERLFEHALHEPAYRAVPRFPAVQRDLSFVFDDAVTWERIHNAVQALRVAELRSFAPHEIFRGGNVPAGKYSVLLRAEFQSPERTLRDDEVAVWSAQLVKALEALGGMLRS